ncbi:MAG: hypothetical protein RLY86_2192, partial [Pseudomonadota bacterium]
AEQLSAVAAARGVVGRVGDLAFALWLPGADGAAAEAMAGDLRGLLEMPQQDGDLSVDLGAAIGLAVHPDHGETADLLMQHAEVAMFTAQRSTTRFRLYDPATDPHRPERLSLMGDLRDAIAADDLRLFYQPKLHLADGRIAGAEGLVRWTHAKRGFVPPDSFIPLAEQTGTIRHLTDWALRTGVAQAAAWAAAGLDIRASINTSARDLNDPALPDRLQALMDGAGIGPDRIVLEVTESAIMDDPEDAVAVLRRLADRGIELSIDDFGVGQSSLAYMRRLPVAELKVDKSFVLKLASSPPDRTIVAAVMRLAHGFNCRVTAEGVEDAESLAILRDLGCDYAQGYHIARPMPSDKFAEFLATGPWQPARIGVAA